MIFEYGAVILEYGAVILEYGAIILEYGAVILEYGAVILAYGAVILEYGAVILEYGAIILENNSNLYAKMRWNRSFLLPADISTIRPRMNPWAECGRYYFSELRLEISRSLHFIHKCLHFPS